MYCMRCGAELSDAAKFCTKCGAKVAVVADDIQGGARPPRRSLKDSLIEFRRTTLKAVPTFVLAIFAVLVAAGAACAAFKLVTEVVVPAIERVVGEDQKAPAATDETDADDAASSGIGKENDEAHKSYQQVLEEYHRVLDEQSEVIAAAGELGTMIDSDSQLAWFGDFWITGEGVEYAYFDIDEDDVDELFISSSAAAQVGAGGILSGFDYVDGEVVSFAQSIERGSYRLVENGRLVLSASGGYDTSDCTVYKWSGEELVTEHSLYWTYVDSEDRGEPDSPYTLHRVIDGTESTETIPYSALDAVIDEFTASYVPEGALDLEWTGLE